MPNETPAAPPDGGTLGRFVRFGFVGASGMVVDFGSFHLLRFLMGTDELNLGFMGRPPYANMVSVALAIQWNFFLNWKWTFKDRGAPFGTAWRRFNVLSSSTWLLNMLIVGLLNTHAFHGPVTVLGVTADALNYWKLIAIGICTFANFFLSTKLAFKADPT